MNRLFWIIGAILAAQACMATMLRSTITDNSAASLVLQESIVLSIGVSSLVQESERIREEFSFTCNHSETPLSKVWVLAHNSVDFSSFTEAPIRMSKSEVRNSFDIENVVNNSVLNPHYTLPTISDCLATSGSNVILNESAANFGDSHLPLQAVIH